MDRRLVAWARAVKARSLRRFPPLWLFTDPGRMPDLLATLDRLPRGLCGIVFRHDGVPGRAALLRQTARSCRARGLPLVVAGRRDGAPAWAGHHHRAARGPKHGRGLQTASAHTVADLVRARRAGLDLAFLSPLAPTQSHAGASGLGPVRWSAFARCTPVATAPLGGADGASVRRLPRGTAAAGAIAALL